MPRADSLILINLNHRVPERECPRRDLAAGYVSEAIKCYRRGCDTGVLSLTTVREAASEITGEDSQQASRFLTLLKEFEDGFGGF